mmetsp:Transcript_12042/g.32420  ORF Transcript_12042/g.32420 Transcript_12042/m.32420 type:complete len:369 (+) Transcript_12042:44-1150(+)
MMQHSGARARARAHVRGPRVASLLPACTENVISLGAAELLVAVSEDCAPLLARRPGAEPMQLPVVARGKFDAGRMSSAEIAAVHRTSSRGAALAAMYAPGSQVATACSLVKLQLCSYFHVDLEVIIRAQPEVVLTHVATDVAAEEEVREALAFVLNDPHVRIVSLDPSSTSEVFAALGRIGAAIGFEEAAAKAGVQFRRALDNLSRDCSSCFIDSRRLRRVAVVQWLDPLYLCGGWVAELMVSILGVEDTVCSPAFASQSAAWSDLVGNSQLDALLVAACGMSDVRIQQELRKISQSNRALEMLIKEARVIVFDARRLFSVPSCASLVDTASVIVDALRTEHQILHESQQSHSWARASLESVSTASKR